MTMKSSLLLKAVWQSGHTDSRKERFVRESKGDANTRRRPLIRNSAEHYYRESGGLESYSFFLTPGVSEAPLESRHADLSSLSPGFVLFAIIVILALLTLFA